MSFNILSVPNYTAEYNIHVCDGANFMRISKDRPLLSTGKCSPSELAFDDITSVPGFQGQTAL